MSLMVILTIEAGSQPSSDGTGRFLKGRLAGDARICLAVVGKFSGETSQEQALSENWPNGTEVISLGSRLSGRA